MGVLLGWAIQVGLGALIAYWISDKIGWNFWLIVVVVVGVYLALRVWGRGLFHAHSSVGGSTGAGGSGHHLLEGMSHPAASFIVWLGVMMVGTYVTGVSNIAAFAEIYSQGGRPWLWINFTLEFLMWVSLAFIAAGIASPGGGRRLPKYVFGPTFVVIFMITHMPWATMAIRPRPETPISVTPGAPMPTGWEDTDAAVAERGVPVVVGEMVGKLLLGDGRTVDRALELPERAAGATGRIVGGSVRALWRGLFPGRPAPAAPRTTPPPGMVARVPAAPPAPVSRSFTTPVELPLNCGFGLSSNDAVMVRFGGRGPFRFSDLTGFVAPRPTPQDAQRRPVTFEAPPGAGEVTFSVTQSFGRCF